MEHSIFVEKYNSNQIAVAVDKNKAGFMYGQSGLIPQKFRAKQALIRTLAFGGFLLGVVMFFVAAWWVAFGVLLLALYMFPQAQGNAANGVLQASLQDPYVYQIALQHQVLIIKELA